MAYRRQLFLYFAAAGCMAAAMGVHDSVFNNFLHDTFHLSAEARGRLELPRELPGFLTVAMAGALCSLAVTRLAVVATVTLAIGLVGVACLGTSFIPMILMMMVASAGMHLLQPIGKSIVLGLSEAGNCGKRMGQAGAVATSGTVVGTATVWFLFNRRTPTYAVWFLVAAVLVCISAVFYSLMHIPHLNRPRPRMVFRKKYRLYYLLEFLFGARKQVFLTFGPWVLIQVYGAQATGIASLLMIPALIGIGFQRFAGYLIDRFGEQRVMIADGCVLSLVCVGYGYALTWMGTPNKALPVASACYILDNLLFTLSNARAAYLSRVAESPEELTSTLAMGVSINHIASMTIPTVAGVIWMYFGYERVFAGAAVLAICISMISTRVPSKRAWALRAQLEAEPVEAEVPAVGK